MENGTNRSDSGFDFDKFIREAKEGRLLLTARKEKLETEIALAQAELEKVQSDIERLDGILGSQPEQRTRQSNVQDLVLDAVREIFEVESAGSGGKLVAERHIVSRVLLKEPTTKEKSVQSVLLRMVKGGKLARHGKRGAYEYALLVPGNEVEPNLPHGQPAGVEDKVVETISQKVNGATEKDLAWAVGDLAIVHPILETLIARGSVEAVEEGGEKFYRINPKIVAEPRTLFDAENPA